MNMLFTTRKIIQRLFVLVTQNRIYGINSFYIGSIRGTTGAKYKPLPVEVIGSQLILGNSFITSVIVGKDNNFLSVSLGYCNK